jgi:Chaperone of endosialidase
LSIGQSSIDKVALNTTGDVNFHFPAGKKMAFDFMEANVRDYTISNAGIDPYLQTSEHEFGIIGSNAKALYSISSRLFYAAAPGNFLSYSDARLKENIKPLAGSLEKLMLLKPVLYDLKQGFFNESRPGYDDNMRLDEMGFLAQDIEKVFPKLVKEQENGMKTVGYMGLIPALTAAMQEQQREILSLKAENETLRKASETAQLQNAAIEARLQRLEAALAKTSDK